MKITEEERMNALERQNTVIKGIIASRTGFTTADKPHFLAWLLKQKVNTGEAEIALVVTRAQRDPFFPPLDPFEYEHVYLAHFEGYRSKGQMVEDLVTSFEIAREQWRGEIACVS